MVFPIPTFSLLSPPKLSECRFPQSFNRNLTAWGNTNTNRGESQEQSIPQEAQPCVAPIPASCFWCVDRYHSPFFATLRFRLRSRPDEPDRAAIRKKMEQAMGPRPSADRQVPLDAKVAAEEKFDGYTRRKVTFAVEKGDRVPAYLLIPTRPSDKKRPAMLCLHQTVAIGKGEPVGLGGKESLHYALHLVKRGFVCLAPDYPSFGDYPLRLQGRIPARRLPVRHHEGDLEQPARDRLSAIVAGSGWRADRRHRPFAGRAQCMFTAAFDERLKVIVSSCGFCSFAKYYGGNLKGWTSDRYMPRIASEYHNDPKQMPFEFADVVKSFAPRAFLAVAPSGTITSPLAA